MSKTRPFDVSLLKTLPDMLENTVKLYPNQPAFSECVGGPKDWRTISWKEFSQEVDCWKKALAASGLKRGDHVAILMLSTITCATADHAVMSAAMTPVPLHAIDNASNCAYILNDSETKLLIAPKTLRWNAIVSVCNNFPHLKEVVVTNDDVIENAENSPVPVITLKDWLKRGENTPIPTDRPEPQDLAALVYTSGTTGKPKGVMLTHANITGDLRCCVPLVDITENDVYLSFLPLSHTFERTVSFYLPLYAGACVAFARNISKLAEDLKIIRPTGFISVPRVFELFYSKIQSQLEAKGKLAKSLMDKAVEIGWRKFCRENKLPVPSSAWSFLDPILWPILRDKCAKPVIDAFGGRVTTMIAGGAALTPTNARFFCGLGLPLRQGYGLTEASPVVAVSPVGSVDPTTIGNLLPFTEGRIGEDNEFQIKGPQVMKGYWKLPEETAAVFTEDGWLKTGDQGEIVECGRIRLTGRIKEIIVTSTGEKIAPNDIEMAILGDSTFSQAMCIGENRPFISAMVVVSEEGIPKLAAEAGADPADPKLLDRRDVRLVALRHIKKATASFPQYGIPRNVHLIKDPWTIENGMQTVTLKLRRKVIAEHYKNEIDNLYKVPQATV